MPSRAVSLGMKFLPRVYSPSIESGHTTRVVLLRDYTLVECSVMGMFELGL